MDKLDRAFIGLIIMIAGAYAIIIMESNQIKNQITIECSLND